MDASWATAYVALGANLGDRQANIRRAVEALGEGDDVQVVRVSRLIETPAEGSGPDAPAYLNGAAEVRTTLPPVALLGRLMEIEAALGRIRRKRWESRRIDLDILLYGDRIIYEPDLIVPHPRMHERLFVLRPLAEIAGDVVHPVLGLPISLLLRQRAPK